jgi:hypothetical protein
MEVLAERAIASGLVVGTYERHDTTVKDDAVAIPQGATPA